MSKQGCGFVLGFALGLCLLLAAYSLQYSAHLEPCSLCLLERYCLWMMTGIFGIAALHRPSGWGILLYRATLLLLDFSGILLTSRHLFLQYGPVPETIVPCTAGLETLLQFKALWEVMQDVILHARDCHAIDRFLGLPLSLWSLGGFILLFFFCIGRNLTHRRSCP